MRRILCSLRFHLKAKWVKGLPQGGKKIPGAKHMGVKDFTPTTAPTLPKKLINSILGMLWGWGTQEDHNLILKCSSDHPLLPDTTG